MGISSRVYPAGCDELKQSAYVEAGASFQRPVLMRRLPGFQYLFRLRDADFRTRVVSDGW